MHWGSLSCGVNSNCREANQKQRRGRTVRKEKTVFFGHSYNLLCLCQFLLAAAFGLSWELIALESREISVFPLLPPLFLPGLPRTICYFISKKMSVSVHRSCICVFSQSNFYFSIFLLFIILMTQRILISCCRFQLLFVLY